MQHTSPNLQPISNHTQAFNTYLASIRQAKYQADELMEVFRAKNNNLSIASVNLVLQAVFTHFMESKIQGKKIDLDWTNALMNVLHKLSSTITRLKHMELKQEEAENKKAALEANVDGLSEDILHQIESKLNLL